MCSRQQCHRLDVARRPKIDVTTPPHNNKYHLGIRGNMSTLLILLNFPTAVQGNMSKKLFLIYIYKELTVSTSNYSNKYSIGHRLHLVFRTFFFINTLSIRIQPQFPSISRSSGYTGSCHRRTFERIVFCKALLFNRTFRNQCLAPFVNGLRARLRFCLTKFRTFAYNKFSPSL